MKGLQEWGGGGAWEHLQQKQDCDSLEESIKVLFCSSQTFREPLDPVMKNKLCLQQTERCFYCQIIKTPKALAKTWKQNTYKFSLNTPHDYEHV